MAEREEQRSKREFWFLCKSKYKRCFSLSHRVVQQTTPRLLAPTGNISLFVLVIYTIFFCCSRKEKLYFGIPVLFNSSPCVCVCVCVHFLLRTTGIYICNFCFAFIPFFLMFAVSDVRLKVVQHRSKSI